MDAEAQFTPDPSAEALVLELDGFEGPLDILLELARTQKVDLRQVSILQLAEQYLAFVAAARHFRLELAADYLVAAAWLAYLKSRLLLPEPEVDDEPSGEELAAQLAFQLQRLEAIRNLSIKLMAQDQLGRDFFIRGQPETVAIEKTVSWKANVLDLIRAYGRLRTKDSYRPLHVERPPVYQMEEALKRLSGLADTAQDWTRLEQFLPEEWQQPAQKRSAVASTFAASLELARKGVMHLEQSELFAPIYVRSGTVTSETRS